MDRIKSKCTTRFSNRTLLFNIYINDFLTFKKNDICNFVEGATPCAYNESLGKVLEPREHTTSFYLIRKQLHETNPRKMTSNSLRSST